MSPPDATPSAHALPVGLERRRTQGVGGGLLAASRPRQWTKNLLVVAAPAAAGVILQGPVLARVSLAFVAFCLLASGTYLINDAADRDADRLHPTKRYRPVAAGRISSRTAIVAGLALLIAGLALSAAVSTTLLAVSVGYVALTATYTVWLKHIVLVDIAAVAGCHVVRAVAGGAAAGVPISRSFLVVVSFASLLVATGKRHAEQANGSAGSPGLTRTTLAGYSPRVLRALSTVAAAMSVIVYFVWAFGARGEDAAVWAALSIVPFCVGILRYTVLLRAGEGEAPEDTLLGDRVMLASLGAWAVLFMLGVTVGG